MTRNRLGRANLYFFLMYLNRDSHRLFMSRPLIKNSLPSHDAYLKGATMLDVILLALGLAFFAVSIGYAYACDRF